MSTVANAILSLADAISNIVDIIASMAHLPENTHFNGVGEHLERARTLARQLDRQRSQNRLTFDQRSVVNAAIASILDALKDDPQPDWRASLADAADALGTLLPSNNVDCKFCHRSISDDTAHRHDDGWVCEECWDERLRSTE